MPGTLGVQKVVDEPVRCARRGTMILELPLFAECIKSVEKMSRKTQIFYYCS